MQDLTAQERKRLMECMQQPEFMNLLEEYTKEISDPTNRRETEEYIRQLEKEQGIRNDGKTQVMIPNECFCIETSSNGNKQVYVNVCSSDMIEKLQEFKRDGGSSFSIPMSLGSKKIEEKAAVFDVTFHSETCARALLDTRFKELIVDSAIENINRTYPEEKVNSKFKFCKFNCRGKPSPLAIRVDKMNPESRVEPSVEKREDFGFKLPSDSSSLHRPKITELSSTDLPSNEKTKPKYTIVHRGEFDMSDHTLAGATPPTVPKELIVRVLLPRLSSASTVDLDISKLCLVLSDETHNYHLDIDLPFPVEEDMGKAQFDKKSKTLVITLPVVKPEAPKPVPFIEPIEEVTEDEPIVQTAQVEENQKEMDSEEILQPEPSTSLDTEKQEEVAELGFVNVPETSPPPVDPTEEPIHTPEANNAETKKEEVASVQETPKTEVQQPTSISFFDTRFTNKYLREID